MDAEAVDGKNEETADEKNDKEEDVVNPELEGTPERQSDMLYGVEEVPWPPMMFVFGLQQAIMTVGGTVSLPFIISGLICADKKPDVTSELLSITMFMCGIATIVQVIFGVRLGIIQGGSHTFVAPIAAIMALDKWACTPSEANSVDDEAWRLRIREIQGNLAIASVTQVLIGCTGFVGILLRFIGPLTIAPTIALIGLSLTSVVIDFNSKHWGIAIFSLALTVLFTLYLNKINLPIPYWSRQLGCHVFGYPLFQLIPVILGICCSWLLCYILTVTDALPEGSPARTDTQLDVLERAPWFYWPYPFQFGTPTVSAGGYVAFLAATLSSIIESVGDYYACARISGAPPPPPHAVNRGIAMEGLASIFSGLVGASHATTSYSGNIGAIGITKVASRSVFLTAGGMLILLGVVGKMGAILSLIPEPVIGGTITVLFGVVTAVGVSNLQFVDLSSTRNLTIFGLSLMLGLSVPAYVNDPKNAGLIHTGSAELDQILTVLLSSAMFVGGVIGCFLDNTVPGTPEERGILSWRQDLDAKTRKGSETSNLYELPLITPPLRRFNWCSYIPVSPTFDKEIPVPSCDCCKRCKRETKAEQKNGTKYVYDNDIGLNSIEVRENEITSAPAV